MNILIILAVCFIVVIIIGASFSGAADDNDGFYDDIG